jgi:hypothetical protein
MWIVYIIFLLTVMSIAYYGLSGRKRKSLKKRNQVLISLLLNINKHFEVESNSKRKVRLVSTSIRGTFRISVSEYGGITFITIKKGLENFKTKRKDWIFLDVMDQRLIFNEVINDLYKIATEWNLGKERIFSLLSESNKSIETVKLENIFFKYNRAAAAYCLAYQALSSIKKKQNLNEAECFEVLFFLCMVSFEKMKKQDAAGLLNMFVNYLLYFLEMRNLLVEVKDVAKLVNHRINMYTEQVYIVKNESDYRFGVLYYYFFVKPLGHKSAFPLEVSEQNNFSNLLIPALIELENKLTTLEDQIKKSK